MATKVINKYERGFVTAISKGQKVQLFSFHF